MTILGALVLLDSGCAAVQKGAIRVFRPDVALERTPRADGRIEFRADVWNLVSSDRLFWRVNGIEQPDATGQKTFVLEPRSGEQTVAAILEGASRSKETARVRVYGQDMTAKAPTVDGAIGSDEWSDPPVVLILPSKQSETWRMIHGLSDEQFSAVARAVWTEDAFWFGIEVVDSTEHSRISDEDARPDRVWKDHVEVRFGSAGKVLAVLDGGFDAAQATFVRADNGTAAGVDVASVRTEKGYALEARVPAQLLGIEPKPGTVTDFQIVVSNDFQILNWNPPQGEQEMGLAVVMPDPTATPSTGRRQLHGGATELKISETATKDPAYLTPLPVEYLDHAAHKPDWLDLKLPWEGTFTVSGGYGFESRSWTHQTISNQNSANDFYALDIDMPTGTPILAPAAGRVVQSGRRGDSYGNYIVIDHGRGIQSVYAHLDSLVYQVDKGEPSVFVEQGQYLGNSGNTGTSAPHLHFALHTGARASHSGANVGGKATCMEPISGYYGIRRGHELTSDNKRVD